MEYVGAPDVQAVLPKGNQRNGEVAGEGGAERERHSLTLPLNLLGDIVGPWSVQILKSKGNSHFRPI